VKYKIELPDKQLACAPISSPEGKAYLGAMAAAANFAWANRQGITHQIRRAMMKVTGRSKEELGLQLVYDVAHNIAKIEQHRLDGREVTVCVHRKGATRAFPAGHPEVPPRYREVGHPVLIPGDMARYSFLAVGTDQAMAETWGSTCHGAGRLRSRGSARRLLAGVDIARRMADQGIVVRAQNPRALAEEASEAYKDVADVIDVLERAGISRKVARMRPIGVIKG
jgi:tRNA-splicing ligase RtcB